MAITPSSWTGTVSLVAATGCTIGGTFTITGAGLNVDNNAEATATYSIESDGAVTVAWDETAGTQTHIYGQSGSVTMPTNFNLDVQSWSADVNMDSTVFSTFASDAKYSKPTKFNVTGTVTGVLEFDASSTIPIPSS